MVHALPIQIILIAFSEMVTLCSSDLSPLSVEVVSLTETVSDDADTDRDSSSRMTHSVHVWRQTAAAACTNPTVPFDEEVWVSDCTKEPVDEFPSVVVSASGCTKQHVGEHQTSAAGYTNLTVLLDEEEWVSDCMKEPVGVLPSAVACTTPTVSFHEEEWATGCTKQHVGDHPSVVACMTPIVLVDEAASATGCMKRHVDGTARPVSATETGYNYSSVNESIYSRNETVCMISHD